VGDFAFVNTLMGCARRLHLWWTLKIRACLTLSTVVSAQIFGCEVTNGENSSHKQDPLIVDYHWKYSHAQTQSRRLIQTIAEIMAHLGFV